MMKRAGIVIISVFIILFLSVVINPALPGKNKVPIQNHAPVIKIIKPENNSRFDWDKKLKYSITVSDKEDGESRYDEIATKEVLLQIKYIGNESKIPKALNKSIQNDAPGLTLMQTSNCFNCHNFNSKSIGPSFYEISKKHTATNANIALLVKRIREGSIGVWGNVQMPSHPELSKQETQQMVQWTLQNASDPNSSFYVGTEGTFTINKTTALRQKTAYMVIASYTDHGLKDDTTQRLKGRDIIIIYSK